jgi:ATP-dependent Clp protease ATP-binding subunit ClpA
MPGPFDRFSDRAKRVLALAQDEAVRFNHSYIGAEHLLLGLTREGEGVAARALDALGVELAKLRSGVEFMVGRGPSTSSPSEITLAPIVKKIIDIAIDESRKLGHNQVGTEHLLLGIVGAGESVAAKLLASLGISLDRLRAQVLATLDMPPVAPRASRAPRPQFGRATADVLSVLTLAREEALTLGHDWIGSEHFLLALLRPAVPFTMRPLLSIGVTYEKARAEVESVAPRKGVTPADPQLTPRAYWLMGYAKGYADLTHAAGGARALLVALVADDEGIGGQVLSKLGATHEKIFDALDRN